MSKDNKIQFLVSYAILTIQHFPFTSFILLLMLDNLVGIMYLFNYPNEHLEMQTILTQLFSLVVEPSKSL